MKWSAKDRAPAKNLVFVTNFNSSSVTIINGANDQTVSQTISTVDPDSIAVDPVLAQVMEQAPMRTASFIFPRILQVMAMVMAPRPRASRLLRPQIRQQGWSTRFIRPAILS
jgi:hypothetical protein